MAGFDGEPLEIGEPISKPSFRLSLPTWGGKYLTDVSRTVCNNVIDVNQTYPLYVFVLGLTKVFFASFIFSSSVRPLEPKKELQRLNTSSWVYVRGRSTRYANPVVENTSLSFEDSTERAFGSDRGSDRADNETIGSAVKEVVMVIMKQEDKGLPRTDQTIDVEIPTINGVIYRTYVYIPGNGSPRLFTSSRINSDLL